MLGSVCEPYLFPRFFIVTIVRCDHNGTPVNNIFSDLSGGIDFCNIFRLLLFKQEEIVIA